MKKSAREARGGGEAEDDDGDASRLLKHPALILDAE